MNRIDQWTVRIARRWLPALALLSMLTAVMGCGSGAVSQPDAADDSLLDELLGDLKSGSGGGQASADRSQRPADGAPAATMVTSAGPMTATAAGERLELRLQQGDRFPLIKTVEQLLIQRSERFPAVAKTRLELTMAIQIDQAVSDAVLMSVRYSRVVYSHDLNGRQLHFDSAVSSQSPSYDIQPYAGMVNNGFSFWLGRDNRIRELVGYHEFLQRCVEQVPADRRQALLADVSQRFGDDGVANFIDDSIGLLPYDDSVDPDAATRVVVGDSWTRESRLMQPAPVYLNSTYRLTGLDHRTAQIDITGRIASGETISNQTEGSLRITGGHSLGNCVVDRVTGLPLETSLTRFISMIVRLPDGQEVSQEKQITTTIRAFPETRGPVVQQLQADRIQPAAAVGVSPQNSASRIPTILPAASSAPIPARAVYPD